MKDLIRVLKLLVVLTERPVETVIVVFLVAALWYLANRFGAP